MKQPALRDQIYQMMDALIHHSNANKKPLSGITLSNVQCQIFADFNKPQDDGHYYYRNVRLRRGI